MIFAFGDQILDLDRCELRRGPDVTELQPQVFELLAYLLRNRHRVISKDELLHAIWGGRAVSDSAFTTRINAVRRALGDDGASQRLIRTYTGKGFRFVGEVTELPGFSVPASATARGNAAFGSVSSNGPSLAVGPLFNLSSDSELDYFADGTIEEIVTALSRIPRLVVIADVRTRSGRRVRAGMPVGTDLGAQYLLTGSVRASRHRLRVTVRVVEAETGVQLWADQVDGSLTQIFDLQDRVAANVAGQIEPLLMTLESGRALGRPATDLSAYDAYLRALAMASSARQISTALTLLERTIACDSHYAPALALAANCCMRLSMDQTSRNPDADARKGADYARRALQAAPNDPGILANSARPLAYAGEDIGGAIALMDHALMLNPNFARGWYVRGFLNYWAGALDAGIADVETAMRLSPRCRFGTPLTAIGNALVFAERFNEAIPKLHRAIQEDRSFPPNYRLLAICYAHLGRLDEARAALTALPNTAPLALRSLERSYRAMSRIPEHRELGLSGIRIAAGDRSTSAHGTN